MRSVSLIVSGPSSFSSARPRARIPVPASSTIISPSARTSTQLVLPPYRIVPGPGTGSEPRTPHSFIRGGTEPSSSGEAVARGRCESGEHTSELQSHVNLVCRLLLDKKKKKQLPTLDSKKNKNHKNITKEQ